MAGCGFLRGLVRDRASGLQDKLDRRDDRSQVAVRAAHRDRTWVRNPTLSGPGFPCVHYDAFSGPPVLSTPVSRDHLPYATKERHAHGAE